MTLAQPRTAAVTGILDHDWAIPPRFPAGRHFSLVSVYRTSRRSKWSIEDFSTWPARTREAMLRFGDLTVHYETPAGLVRWLSL